MMEVIRELLGDALSEEDIALLEKEFSERYVLREDAEQERIAGQEALAERDARIAGLEEQLREQALSAVVERELLKAGARNVRAVKALLDTDALSVEGDKVVGLSEQIEALKESDGYLFEQETPYVGAQGNFVRRTAMPDQSGLTYSQEMRLRRGILS